MGKIIVVGGTKGGTGKTTLATNLVVIGSKMGQRMLLVDADEQGSASDWAEQRETLWKAEGIESEKCPTLNFPTIKLGGTYLYEQLKRFRKDFDSIVVDAGGRDTTSQRSALIIADTFLVPFKPRSFDVWTAGKIKLLIQEVKPLNPELKVIICINQADSRGMDNDDAHKILSEIPHYKCLLTFVGHRKAFPNAASQGLAVGELDKIDQKASDEIYSVYQAIYE